MQKTIKALIPPKKEKGPTEVVFTDDTKAQFWPTQKFGAELKEGVTAECVTEDKVNGQYTNTYLIQWGDKVQKGFGGGGLQPKGRTPEETRSIAIQCMAKTACDFENKVEDSTIDDVLISAEKLMRYYDSEMSKMPAVAAQAPLPKAQAPQAPAAPIDPRRVEAGEYCASCMTPDAIKAYKAHCKELGLDWITEALKAKQSKAIPAVAA